MGAGSWRGTIKVGLQVKEKMKRNVRVRSELDTRGEAGRRTFKIGKRKIRSKESEGGQHHMEKHLHQNSYHER